MDIRYLDYSSFDSFMEYFGKVDEVAVKEHELQYLIDNPDEVEKKVRSIVEIRDRIINDKNLDSNSQKAYISKLERSLRTLGFYRSASSRNLSSGSCGSCGSRDYWKAALATTSVSTITAAVLAYLLGKEYGKQETFAMREQAKEVKREMERQIEGQHNLRSAIPPDLSDNSQPDNSQTARNMQSMQRNLVEKLLPLIAQAQIIGEKIEKMESQKEMREEVVERNAEKNAMEQEQKINEENEWEKVKRKEEVKKLIEKYMT